MSDLNLLTSSKNNIDLDNSSYYKVGQQVYKSKLLALYEATQSGIHPTWHFGDEIFSQLKWNEGYVEDIFSIYQKRAKQLREKYDYLVISYSGGADSRTLLEAFLSQGIEPDEVLVAWPVKATKGLYTPNLDRTTGANILSEWDLVIKDDLAYLNQYYPKIKITIDDYSEKLLHEDAELVDNDWHTINDHMNPNVFQKYAIITKTEAIMMEKGKKSAKVWGVDKPQVMYKDGHLYIYFLDKLVNTRSSDALNNRKSELFYWSLDFPELVHAQARLVYYFFLENPQYLRLINWEQRGEDPIKKKNQLNVFMKQIVYPTWNMNRFQAHKPTTMVWQETDTWFFKNFTHTRYYQSWYSQLQNIIKSVDKKYHQPTKNKKFEGWVGFLSNVYDLGPIHFKES